MYLISKSAIDLLNKQFSLPATGAEQDWDIELSDEERTEEFLAYLETEPLADDVSFALMALILASFEEMLDLKMNTAGIWERIKQQLTGRKPLYDELIKYYKTTEVNADMWFPLTPFMREL